MDMTYLAKDCIYPSDITKTGINENEVIIGPTRCGKTKSIVEPRLLHNYNKSLVISVTKRKLYDDYAKVFVDRGFLVYDINLNEPGKSKVGYDPFSLIKNEKDAISLAISLIGDRESQDMTGFSDPYWNQSAVSALSALIILSSLYADYMGVDMCFSVFKKIYDRALVTTSGTSTESAIDSLFDQMQEVYPNSSAYRLWKTVRGNAPKTTACIISIMNNAVDKLMEEETTYLFLNKNKIDLSIPGKQKTVVFITSSPVDSSLQKLATILYKDLFSALYNEAQSNPQRELKWPVHFIFDDFACGYKVPDFAKYISILCASRISVTLLLQSESQLSTLYGNKDATTILNNCDTYVYMGGSDHDTVKNISARLDIPPRQIYEMPLLSVIVCRRGSRSIISTRYPILSDPEYQKLFSK